MPIITLPDGTKKQFDRPVTVAEVAQSIGAGLAKAALAGEIDGVLVDTSRSIETDQQLRIITIKDAEALDIIRHSCAHLMAQAVKSLFPTAQVTIGPVIENGFYYDFSYERAFTPEDLEKIEKKMIELASSNQELTRKVLNRSQAIDLFDSIGEKYKIDIIKELDEDEQITAYQQGDFIDLCRGPHVPSTGFLKAFKLTKLAGAYWRGDSDNEMLQRIYGTAWGDKKALNAYLARIEEAQKRDHRLLAKKMDLFHFQEEAPGMVFWHPNGWRIIVTMREYIRDLLARHGYQEINTPQLVDSHLWEKSGHKSKYNEDMFSLNVENREYVVKPMSCPCHVQVFKQGLKSYRDLPIRFSEFGCCHRNEASGTLHGLMRVRGFVQDDAHVFCTDNQIQEEVFNFIRLLQKVYADFGFEKILYKLSTRPESRIGSDAIWDKAEQALAQALDQTGVEWAELPGEGAFYGPKIDFSLQDCLGRVWQCGTVQLDFSMPDRLDAHYIAEDGSKHVPVMIHRAILGSFERFTAILLEHYAGVLPLWLAPIQMAILNISDAQAEYAKEISKEFEKIGIKVILDLRNEKIGYKIREHTMAKVPYLIILGDREVAEGNLSVRDRSGKTVSMTLSAFSERVLAQIAMKGEHH